MLNGVSLYKRPPEFAPGDRVVTYLYPWGHLRCTVIEDCGHTVHLLHPVVGRINRQPWATPNFWDRPNSRRVLLEEIFDEEQGRLMQARLRIA